MKHNFSFILIASLVSLASCSNGQVQNNNTNLSAAGFADKIKELPKAPILDVRTPDEFSKGHLTKALNYDWNGDEFDKQIATLDKSTPVLVYCLSGGRSAAAASKMRSEGFKTVYELDGGIMKWRRANLPETTENAVISSNGMTKQQFEALLNSEKMVLVDFYADWCGPCKKMKPYLDKIAIEWAEQVVVVRINADDNQTLSKELNIDALPTLLLYKNNALTWKNVGYVKENEIVKHLQ